MRDYYETIDPLKKVINKTTEKITNNSEAYANELGLALFYALDKQYKFEHKSKHNDYSISSKDIIDQKTPHVRVNGNIVYSVFNKKLRVNIVIDHDYTFGATSIIPEIHGTKQQRISIDTASKVAFQIVAMLKQAQIV